MQVAREAPPRGRTCPCLYLWVAGSSKVPEWAVCPLFVFQGRSYASADELARIRDAAERVARSYGLEIFDVQFRREPVGMVLRVVIDRPDPGRESTCAGRTRRRSTNCRRVRRQRRRADCQHVSHDLSALLDVEDDLGERSAYTLEVSSPGLDRPLRHEADYRRFAGRLAKIVTTRAGRRPERVRGPARRRRRRRACSSTRDGQTHRVPLDAIKRGDLEVEF